MPRSSYSARSRDEHGPVFTVLVLAILFSAALMVSQSGEARLRKSVQIQSDTVISPLIGFITQPVRGLEDVFGRMSDRRRAYEENVVLRSELQHLREENARLQISQEEIARYEDMLGVNIESNVPLTRVAARAVNDVTGPFVRAALINAGKNKNVRLGQAVMTPSGMVGHIILVGSKSSRVLRVDDLNSRIPVMSERSGSVAILAGDNTANPKLIFSQIGADWQEGDNVVTSGDDGRLPRGLHIGTVQTLDKNEIRVSVSSFQEPLDWIWVAQFEPIERPESLGEAPVSEDESSLSEQAEPTTGSESEAVEKAEVIEETAKPVKLEGEE